MQRLWYSFSWSHTFSKHGWWASISNIYQVWSFTCCQSHLAVYAQPTDHHLVAAKRILNYVQGTLGQGLTFWPGPLSLTAFTDSDWANDPMDWRSIIGLIVFLGNNPITWQSKKQPIVSPSSMDYKQRRSNSIYLHWWPTYYSILSSLSFATLKVLSLVQTYRPVRPSPQRDYWPQSASPMCRTLDL